ncbi:MAG: heme A synthase [Thiohalomonadaceae bacterium]
MTQRRLLTAVLLLALGVIALGSYVRLSNAGLGCPDWPGCYGRLVVPGELRASGAEAHARAWIEMVHRYAAGFLGLCIAALAVAAFRRRAGRLFAGALALLVVFQALLGMWTVTLRLQPAIVMGHLLGGLGLLSLLWLWRLDGARAHAHPRLRPLALVAVAAVVLQIALGGWTSANYAAIACPDFPTCQGRWWPEADFAEGFSLPAAVAGSWEGGGHTGEGRIAIHLAHRLGALFAVLASGFFAAGLVRAGGPLRPAGLILAAALLLQFSLGMGNVLLGVPLPVAVAHAAGAALLLLSVLWGARSVLARAP